MSSPNCGFCTSLGIKGPHDHWMRRLVNNNYETICPKLLQTICQSCFKKGHTARYCRMDIREKQRKGINKAMVKPKTESKIESKIESKTESKFGNIWGALCMENDDSSDEESIPDKPYVYLKWADVDTDDDELPPIPVSWRN